MTKEEQEPVERLEEILPNHANQPFNALHDQGLKRKKELVDERQELAALLNKLPNPPPKKGAKGYETYIQIQQQIQDLKARISKTHNDLMEILKNEEALSREIEEKER